MRDPVNSCYRKLQYPNKRKAESAAQNMRRRFDVKHGSPLVAYHCAHCGNWHVGNEKRKR